MKKNHLFYLNNLEVLKRIPDKYVDLVYADPPYNTGVERVVGTRPIADIEMGVGYKDKMSEEDYKNLMISTFIECYRVIKDTGSLFLHINYEMSFEFKSWLDGIFSKSNFVTQIIWQRKGQGHCSFVGSYSKKFSSNYDTILHYSKSGKKYFKPQIIAHTKEYVNEKFKKDENGELYYDIPIWNKSTVKKLEEKGLITGRNTTSKYGEFAIAKRYYKDMLQGSVISNIWTDISNVAKPDYPTQKPVKLLTRIIDSSCPPGGIVLDPFMGSGTTCVAAYQNGMMYIGIDEKQEALDLTKKRLDEIPDLFIEGLVKDYTVDDYSEF